jgi:hypothetical protein
MTLGRKRGIDDSLKSLFIGHMVYGLAKRLRNAIPINANGAPSRSKLDGSGVVIGPDGV